MSPTNITYYDPFAALFGSCLYRSTDIASFYIGLISILCWILCIVPQFVINCKNGTRSTLSPYLFILWLVGDTFNLTGSLLTNQLLFQKMSCFFFVFMDCLNIGQYIYFTRKNNKIEYLNIEDDESFIDPETGPTTSGYISINNVILTTALLSSESSALCLDQTTDITPEKNIIGLILGSLAGIMYVLSRVSQLHKIRKDRSVKGLLLSMFIFSVLGNLTYLTAIFLKNNNLLNSLPWLICSCGVLLLDLTIICHFYLYQNISSLNQN